MRADHRMLELVYRDFGLANLDVSLLLHPPADGGIYGKGSFKVLFITDLIDLSGIRDRLSSVHCVLTTSELQAVHVKAVFGVPAFWLYEPFDSHYDYFTGSASDIVQREIVMFGYSNSIERTMSSISYTITKVFPDYTFKIYSERIPNLEFCKTAKVVFRKFTDIGELNDGTNRYFVVSDICADLSLATDAKSLNKLISGLRMNMIPIILTFFDKYKVLKSLENYPLLGGREILTIERLNEASIAFLTMRKNVLREYNDLYLSRRLVVLQELKEFISLKPNFLPTPKIRLDFSYSIRREFKQFLSAIRKTLGFAFFRLFNI